MSLKILGKSINSIPLFNFYEMSFVICFRIDKWTESMLSRTSSQECSTLQLMMQHLTIGDSNRRIY